MWWKQGEIDSYWRISTRNVRKIQIKTGWFLIWLCRHFDLMKTQWWMKIKCSKSGPGTYRNKKCSTYSWWVKKALTWNNAAVIADAEPYVSNKQNMRKNNWSGKNPWDHLTISTEIEQNNRRGLCDKRVIIKYPWTLLIPLTFAYEIWWMK